MLIKYTLNILIYHNIHFKYFNFIFKYIIHHNVYFEYFNFNFNVLKIERTLQFWDNKFPILGTSFQPSKRLILCRITAQGTRVEGRRFLDRIFPSFESTTPHVEDEKPRRDRSHLGRDPEILKLR